MTGVVTPPRDGSALWRVVTGAEVVLAVAVVLMDLSIPTLVLLAVMTASLLVRRQGLASLGLSRPDRAGRMAGEVLGLSAAWTLLTLAVTMPMLEHLTGERQDVSQFADLEGNLPATLAMVALSWTLAALGEELAYRGYLQTRMVQLLPPAAPSVSW